MHKTLWLPFFCVIAATLALTSGSFAAAYKGSVSFTEMEKTDHINALTEIMDTAARCLQDDLNRHHLFMKKYGISGFYGDNSAFAKTKSKDLTGKEISLNTSDEEKRIILRTQYNVPEWLVQEFVPSRPCANGSRECPLKMEPTSCIGLVMKCLGKGFESAGQGAIWARIKAFTDENGVQGDALQDALQILGWKIVYWNPNTTKALEWDLEEQKQYPGNPKHIWGQHAETWKNVQTRQRYYLNKVDDYWSLADFGRRPPRFLKDIPFFVGIAHIGYHVFPGSYGQIIEGHSTRALNDREALESSEFNPLKIGGGPRGGPYKSGILAVPPGFGIE